MDIHPLESSNGSINYVFHINVPSGNNDAGVPWWECVKSCREYPKTTAALQHNDLGDILAGKMIEVRGKHTFSEPGLTDSQKFAEPKELYLIIANEVISDMMVKFRVYGFEGDV